MTAAQVELLLKWNGFSKLLHVMMETENICYTLKIVGNVRFLDEFNRKNIKKNKKGLEVWPLPFWNVDVYFQ